MTAREAGTPTRLVRSNALFDGTVIVATPPFVLCTKEDTALPMLSTMPRHAPR